MSTPNADGSSVETTGVIPDTPVVVTDAMTNTAVSEDIDIPVTSALANSSVTDSSLSLNSDRLVTKPSTTSNSDVNAIPMYTISPTIERRIAHTHAGPDTDVATMSNTVSPTMPLPSMSATTPNQTDDNSTNTTIPEDKNTTSPQVPPNDGSGATVKTTTPIEPTAKTTTAIDSDQPAVDFNTTTSTTTSTSTAEETLPTDTPLHSTADDTARATNNDFQPPRSPEQAVYYTRVIQFGKRSCSIICQNENGPCPLLALCNVLLLQGRMTIHPHIQLVDYSRLVEMLSDILLTRPPASSHEQQLAYESSVQSSVELFPTLQYGLDVNVKFHNCRGFEFTKQLELFDIFEVSLFHGWLVDPQNVEAACAVGKSSYNQLMEIMIDAQSPADDATADPTALSEKVLKASTIENWLSLNQTQLTYHGICELHATMKNFELGVLFRNNHFFVILKRNTELLTLVTDQGFSQTDVVWETLSSVGGESHFLNDRFGTLQQGYTE